MKLFSSAQEIEEVLSAHERIICDCLEGRISFTEFVTGYDDFYMRYALDGHESDPDERELLARFAPRIALHQSVWEEVLTRVCDDDDAGKAEYIRAGRFGSAQGMTVLRRLADRHRLVCG